MFSYCRKTSTESMIDVTFFYVQGQLTSGLTVLQFLLPSFAFVNRIGLVEGVKSLRNGWFKLTTLDTAVIAAHC